MAKQSLYEIVQQFADKDEPIPSMDTLAKAAYQSSRLSTIVRYLERKTTLEPDDIRQTLVMALCTAIERGDTTFDTENNLYSFLVRVGINVGLSKLREPETKLIALDAMESSQDQTGPMFSDSGVQAQAVEDNLDRNKLRGFIKGIKLTQYNKNLMLHSSHLAQEMHETISKGNHLKKDEDTVNPLQAKKSTLMTALRGMTLKVGPKLDLRTSKKPAPAVVKTPARRGRPPGPRSEQGRVMAADHKELLELYKKSQLLQTDYAVALNLSSAAFKSYIYGRTRGVPEAVMLAARLHAKEAAPRVSVLDEKFSGPMADILKRWEDEIANQKLSSSKLATILDIDETTVMRWRKDSKPTVRALSRYELKLKDFFKK